jgi:hypothetical protein
VDWKALEIVHPDAAGIDVGGSEHWVAISPERDPKMQADSLAGLIRMAERLGVAAARSAQT